MRGKGKKQKPQIVTNQEMVAVKRHSKRLHYLRERRKMRMFEIKLVRMRTMMRLASILLFGWLLFKLMLLPQWYIKANIFDAYPSRNLSIEGNKIVPVSKVMTQLKSIKLPHKPLYMVSTKPIEKSILKLTPIDKVYIRRFWFPARLKIVVQERVPTIAMVPSPQAQPSAVFTNDIKIINSEFLPLPPSMKPYKIVTNANFYKWTEKQVNYLAQLSELLETLSGEKIKYLDIRDPDDVYVQLDNVRIRLGEMNPNLEKRAKRLHAVLPQTGNLISKINYIDLRWENSVAIKLKDQNQVKADQDKKKAEQDKLTTDDNQPQKVKEP